MGLEKISKRALGPFSYVAAATFNVCPWWWSVWLPDTRYTTATKTKALAVEIRPLTTTATATTVAVSFYLFRTEPKRTCISCLVEWKF